MTDRLGGAAFAAASVAAEYRRQIKAVAHLHRVGLVLSKDTCWECSKAWPCPTAVAIECTARPAIPPTPNPDIVYVGPTASYVSTAQHITEHAA